MMKMGWPSATVTVVALFLLFGVYIPACWFTIKALLRRFSPARFAKNEITRYLLLFLVLALSVPYLATQGLKTYVYVSEEWRSYKYYRYVLLLENMPKYIMKNTDFSDVQLCRGDYILINSPSHDKKSRMQTVKDLCNIATKNVLNSKYSTHYVKFVILDSPRCPTNYYELEHTAPEAIRIMCFNSGFPMVSGGKTP